MRRHLRALALIAVTACALVTVEAASPASAATTPGTMAGQSWLVKDNDWHTIGGAGTFQWSAWGTATGGTYGTTWAGQDAYPAEPGNTRTFASWTVLRRDAAQILPGQWVLWDTEWWKFTPAFQRADPQRYTRLAIALVHAHGGHIITTSCCGINAKIAQAADAAAHGADVVAVQTQVDDRDPAAFTALVKRAVAAVRAVSPATPILAGLSSDAGGIPATAADMTAEWKATHGLVQGFWLNAARWKPPAGQGCAPRGCPATVRAFLKAIGAVP